MADISAFILAKNEAENVGPLMDSLSGVRDVVVLDNGSTDDTVELFRKAGARVYDGTQVGKHLVTAADVEAFTELFGYAPQFKGGEVFDDSGERRNYAAAKCRNDWVLNPDCDERVEGDLRKISAGLNGQTAVLHRYVHKHNPDGTPHVELTLPKLYNRRKARYTGRIHEVLISTEPGHPELKAPFCPDLVLHHYQRERAWRGNHTDQLEYQALKEETPRNLHYLGREYVERGWYDKALTVYDRYFAMDDFPDQQAQAWMTRAECFRELNRTNDAIDAYHEAMALDDKRREPFFFLGQIYLAQDKPRKALIYFTAANSIPYSPANYTSDLRMYTWGTHDNLSLCYLRLGDGENAFRHWMEALKWLPEGMEGDRILGNGRFMVKRGEGMEQRA